MHFDSFFSDLLATVVGGIALTILFFVSKEKFFPLPALSGRFYFEQKTDTTEYGLYADMVLRYVVLIIRVGDKIEGTAEKIYERSKNGERTYVGSNRIRGEITGYVEKKYFGKDKIYLHMLEDGSKRKSSTLYMLEVTSKCAASGKFVSTIADQTGAVKWQSQPF